MSTPEIADSAPASAHVAIEVAFVFTPDSAAAYGFNAVARRRRPSDVNR